MCCGSFVSKFWNRQNAYSVPDSEIRINSIIQQDRNNRYSCQNRRRVQGLRDAPDEEFAGVVTVVSIIPNKLTVPVITIIYIMSTTQRPVCFTARECCSNLGVDSG
jgi:hypothetical protein